MAKLVLLRKADSIYEDEPDVVYDFPQSYLRAVKEAIGDWIIYYEPVKAGPRGYFAVARIGQWRAGRLIRRSGFAARDAV